MKVYNFFYLFLTVTCISCAQNDKITLTVETENSIESTNNLNFNESKEGFEIEIDEKFRKVIHDKTVKEIILTNGKEKIIISLFNIFYTPRDNVMYQTPSTPKGSIAVFKKGSIYFIDVKTKDNKVYLRLLGNGTD